MIDHAKRQDQKAAEQVREAQAMLSAFGFPAAEEFLARLRVSEELAQRVLTAPPQHRRY